MGCGAVIVAAGSSRRMGSRDKISQVLMGRPVIDWVLDGFAEVHAIEELVVVVGAHNERPIKDAIVARQHLRHVVCCRGGSTRQESVARGVARLSPRIDLVLIHDAARPLVTRELIEAGLAAGHAWGAAVAAVPLADTIKAIAPGDVVARTLPRDELRAAQTPQVFRRDWLESAYRLGPEGLDSITDEASLLEQAGFPVHLYPGSQENLKLTTPTDLLLAEVILRQRGGGWVA